MGRFVIVVSIGNRVCGFNLWIWSLLRLGVFNACSILPTFVSSPWSRRMNVSRNASDVPTVEVKTPAKSSDIETNLIQG